MNILFCESHPDDISISCLGAYFLHQTRGDRIIHVCVSECDDLERNKTLGDEVKEVMTILKPDIPMRYRLPNRELNHPKNMKILRERLEIVRKEIEIDVIYCPSIKDIHQDHKAVAEEVIRVFRRHTILMYENNHSTPKFHPNYYIPLTMDMMQRKNEILNIFESQNPAKLKELSLSMACQHGNEIGVEYAEAFEVWKVVNWELRKDTSGPRKE